LINGTFSGTIGILVTAQRVRFWSRNRLQNRLPRFNSGRGLQQNQTLSVRVGLGSPKGTPGEIIERLNQGINAGLADPAIKTRLVDMGGTPLSGSPADYGKLIADETEKWGQGDPRGGHQGRIAQIVGS